VVPSCKAILSHWAHLAARAAFRKGIVSYCGHRNPVEPGTWAGGIVGLKSILGVKKREQALDILRQLSDLGYLSFELDAKTKLLTYRITDYELDYCGAPCDPGAVYATPGYGFLCVPRRITERLLSIQYYKYEESDAFLDLWCHTVSMDPRNAFSFFAPVCQYGKYGVFLTLENLGQRWGWEKTKVWRFLQKHADVFALCRLPGSYGCLIFNTLYPCDTEVSLPTDEQIANVLEAVRGFSRHVVRHGLQREHMSRMVVWYSRRYLLSVGLLSPSARQNRRVALFHTFKRAYISLCWIWKNDDYDCQGVVNRSPPQSSIVAPIRGPCSVDLNEYSKELFSYA
jgi:hypothetical protein